MRSATNRQLKNGIVLSLAVAGSALAEANSVNIIYATENALYGAGYDIGRADGWMDERLRRAVRDYQARSGNLSVTGNLDSATLSSLGIASNAGRTVADNVVASKAQALAALGMTEARTHSKPDPKTRLQPKPEFTVNELPAEPKPKPVVKQAPSNPAPATTQVVAEAEPAETEKVAPKATSEAARRTTFAAPNPVETSQPVRVAKAEPAPVPRVQTTVPDVNPASQKPAVVPVSSDAPASQPAPQVSVESQPDPDTSPSENSKVPEIAGQLPEEPTAAVRPETDSREVPVTEAGPETSTASSTTASEPGKKSGNIFGTLFDFLFGWLV